MRLLILALLATSFVGASNASDNEDGNKSIEKKMTTSYYTFQKCDEHEDSFHKNKEEIKNQEKVDGNVVGQLSYYGSKHIQDAENKSNKSFNMGHEKNLALVTYNFGQSDQDAMVPFQNDNSNILALAKKEDLSVVKNEVKLALQTTKDIFDQKCNAARKKIALEQIKQKKLGEKISKVERKIERVLFEDLEDRENKICELVDDAKNLVEETTKNKIKIQACHEKIESFLQATYFSNDVVDKIGNLDSSCILEKK